MSGPGRRRGADRYEDRSRGFVKVPYRDDDKEKDDDKTPKLYEGFTRRQHSLTTLSLSRVTPPDDSQTAEPGQVELRLRTAALTPRGLRAHRRHIFRLNDRQQFEHRVEREAAGSADGWLRDRLARRPGLAWATPAK